jgi:hypothetical protein
VGQQLLIPKERLKEISWQNFWRSHDPRALVFILLRKASASMSAFEFRPKRPPHSSFCKEVYIFALSALKPQCTKRQLWSLVEIKKMVAGASVAPETLTTKRQSAKSRDGREQEPIRKSILLRTK